MRRKEKKSHSLQNKEGIAFFKLEPLGYTFDLSRSNNGVLFGFGNLEVAASVAVLTYVISITGAVTSCTAAPIVSCSHASSTAIFLLKTLSHLSPQPLNMASPIKS